MASVPGIRSSHETPSQHKFSKSQVQVFSRHENKVHVEKSMHRKYWWYDMMTCAVDQWLVLHMWMASGDNRDLQERGRDRDILF